MDRSQDRLRGLFQVPEGAPLPLGVVSPLQEDDERFYAMAVLAQDTHAVRVAR